MTYHGCFPGERDRGTLAKSIPQSILDPRKTTLTSDLEPLLFVFGRCYVSDRGRFARSSFRRGMQCIVVGSGGSGKPAIDGCWFAVFQFLSLQQVPMDLIDFRTLIFTDLRGIQLWSLSTTLYPRKIDPHVCVCVCVFSFF